MDPAIAVRWKALFLFGFVLLFILLLIVLKRAPFIQGGAFLFLKLPVLAAGSSPYLGFLVFTRPEAIYITILMKKSKTESGVPPLQLSLR